MSNSEEHQLAEIRDRIDSVDRQLIELINERANLAQQVALVKRTHSGETVFYRPEREAQVLRKIRGLNPGPLGDEEMVRIFVK